MHQTTGRWKLGLALATTTALMWGGLPLILKLLLDSMDAYTITWFRFLVATFILGIVQARRGALPRLNRLDRRGWLLMAIAAAGLAGNYLLYLTGLEFITPGAAQVVIQLAPMLLMLGGLVIFGEHFGAWQWRGFALLGFGLVLFFNHRFDELLSGAGGYGIGILLVLVAAVSWTAYALAQKQLLKVMRSENVMLCLYAAGILVFLLPASPASIMEISGFTLTLLILASLNTLIAYGAFAEALDHWEASRVSAVLAVTPLLTLGLVTLTGMVSSAVVPEPLNGLSLLGALMVVAGSMLAALLGRRTPPAVEARAGLE